MGEPQSMLKTLVRIALDLCQANTAGVSLLETAPNGESTFRWIAMAGALEFLEQTTTSGDFSPCGTILHCNQAQLYAHPERYFTYLHHPQFPIVEGLLVPLSVNHQPLGTLWILSHDVARRFDCEDQRLMTSLAGFAASALQSIHHLGQTAQDALQREQETRVALQHSQIQFEALVANVPGMVYRYLPSTDSPHQFTLVSSGSRELLGLEPETILQDADTLVALIHPDDLPSFQTSVAHSAQNFLSWRWEGRIITPSGQPKWIQGNSHAVRSAAGDVWDGLLTDITDHKRAEAALRQSEEFNRQILDSSDDCIKVLDLSGQLLYMSPGGQALLGINDIKPLLNRSWSDLWRGADGQAAMNAIDTAKAGKVCTFQGYCPTFTGEPKWWDSKVSPIKGADGQVERLLCISRDITGRKQAEAEREQLLAREQASREQAETANRIKDEFLAVLSHELRSPLNPILGWSSLLQTRKLDEAKMAQALAAIQRNARLQSELIEDLLDVSRILRGKLSLNVGPVDLVTTIQAAMETVRLAAEAKSIQVQAIFASKVGQVAGDSTRLQQVIWNLVSNAVKFTPEGGQVNIRLEHVGSHAQIIVSDTGQGIHPDFLPHVFDYFRQADAATTRKFGGLGLGLAIVRHIVELHGGTVGVESPGSGQGTTFVVQLPLMTTQSKPNHNSGLSEGSSDLGGMKILVVDDETDTRELTAFLLEQYGARVTAVSSAYEALVALTQSKPDVLLSDIGMPDMDGYMLIQQVRTLPAQQGGQIPAIALTAYAGEMNQQQALTAGFQKHISKPIESRVLVQAISSLVRSI
jgi:PAS domain S-box-containing protein